jgi:hypothetical protein
MRYAFIRDHEQQFAVRSMCRMMKVHPSGVSRLPNGDGENSTAPITSTPQGMMNISLCRLGPKKRAYPMSRVIRA